MFNPFSCDFILVLRLICIRQLGARRAPLYFPGFNANYIAWISLSWQRTVDHPHSSIKKMRLIAFKTIHCLQTIQLNVKRLYRQKLDSHVPRLYCMFLVRRTSYKIKGAGTIYELCKQESQGLSQSVKTRREGQK
jgi:hypothetical protein